MNPEIINEIIEKSKTKKDGIYSHKGIDYRVSSNRVKFLSDGWKIYQLCYGFVSVVYDPKEYNRMNLKKKMKEI